MQFTVRPGKRDGYTEIEFTEKPHESVRSTLKRAGYRWSPRFQVWYGLSEDLPCEFQTGQAEKTQEASDDVIERLLEQDPALRIQHLTTGVTVQEPKRKQRQSNRDDGIINL